MKYFVSLGIGNHQLPLLIALKNLNYKIIGIDQNPHAIGRNYCDIFFENSIFDLKENIKFLKDYKNQIDGIYSRSYGKAVKAANELAKEFHLVHNPSESLSLFENKKNILNIALEHSYLKKQKEMFTNLERSEKWIIKKIDSHGKQEIHLENEYKNLIKFINFDKHLIEPFFYKNINSREYIFFGIIINKQLFPLIITEKEVPYNKNPIFEELSFCDKYHFYPSQLTPLQKYKIFQIANYIVKKTNLLWGPFLCEFIVDNEDIFFLEAAPEVGGEFIADDLIPFILGFSYFEYLIQIYTNQNLNSIKENLNLLLTKEKKNVMMITYIFQENGTFLDLIFPEKLYRSEYFYFARKLKQEKTSTKIENKNIDRIGAFALGGNLPLVKMKDLSYEIEKEIIKKYLK